MDGDFAGTDRFVIERQLGAGSMGAVYLAYDRKLAGKVALKLLLSVDAAGIYRFKKEFRALADVTHRNLVMLHELFSEGDRWFFTMEFVEGRDLLTYVHGGRRRTYDSAPRALPDLGDDERPLSLMPEPPLRGLEMLFPTPLENGERLRAVLLQVVEGLSAVHRAGKLHRDLKPENVLVTPEGRVVLLDFGIALEQQKDAHETLASVVGTPAYMAPEQCRGRDLSEASDWYALGVILYEALTGDVPFDGTPMQVIARKQEVDPVAPSEVVSGIPDDLSELCMQLLQRDPAKRPNGEALLRALQTKRAASLPVPGMDPTLAAIKAPFLGRDAHVRQLRAALERTAGGQPVVALVHGPSGIGKTMLVQRFLEGVITSDAAIVLKGRCYERESMPFKALDNVVDALSRYLRRLPAVEAARMLPRDVDALASVFPVLRRVEVLRRDRRMRPLPPDPLELRQRAFRALKEMFSRITDLEPLIVYVDDLQWSDVDSAKLLIELITGSDRPALMLVAVYRSEESSASEGMQLLLEHFRINRELQVYDLPVPVLSPEDSYALARELLGPSAPEEGARKLGFESGGSPHMLAQLVRHVQERRASGKASPETARGLISFERVLEQRLSALSTDARSLLQLLSVAARPVPEGMLTLVASFNVDLPSALSELRGAKLVRGVSVHGVRAVETYHDSIRDAVTASLSVDVLVSWHRRLAAALEASGAIDLEALTEHLLGANERTRASLYAARAAAQADKALAFEKAARLYGIASEHAQDPKRRGELLRAFADALMAAGRGADSARAYERAAEQASEPEASELRALAGTQLLLCGELELGLAMVREPLRAIGVELDASLREAGPKALQLWQELRERGFSFQERPPEQIERAALARIDLMLGVARGLLLHETDRPLPLLARLLRDALEVGEPARILSGLALFHIYLDVPCSALAKVTTSGALDVAEALARRMVGMEGRAAISLAKGLSVYLNGQIEPALQELRKAEELLRNHCRGMVYEMRLCRQAIAHLLLIVQRDPDSPLVREWLREADNHGDNVGASRLRQQLAIGLLAGDDADAANAQIDASLAGTRGLPQWSATNLLEAFARAQVQLYRGDADGCRASFYLLEDGSGSSAYTNIPLWRGVTLLLRARLALLARAAPGASSHMLKAASDAADEAARLDLPCLERDLQLVRASLLVAQGRRAEAQPLLNAASTTRDAQDPSIAVLFAQRALAQLTAGGAAAENVDTSLRKRGIANPRRYARMFCPGFEELVARTTVM
ncbi:MAG TPA: protein kinase [Polyangiales bacterium]|nr:protein kinase [Polyangiales bacterium]